MTQNQIEFVKVKKSTTCDYRLLVKILLLPKKKNCGNDPWTFAVLQVRHLELKREKVVQREELVRFLLAAMAVQFRNPSVWS